MTKVRQTLLQNAYVLPDSGELVTNVGTDAVITRLDIQLQATNGATNNKHATALDCLTQVDIMDGSQPIVSASGSELAGMAANRWSRMLNGVVDESPSAVQYVRIPLEFGRWFGDEQLALDCSKFTNLQIRTKFNLAAVRAVGATGFVSGTGRLTMLAHIMEGGANPSGYLSVKRHALFTTAASGVQPFDLPVDKLIRSIGIRTILDGTGKFAGISHAKLNLNESKEIPFDIDTIDLLESLMNDSGTYEYRHIFHAQNTNVLYGLLKYFDVMELTSETATALAQATNTGIGEDTLSLITTSTGAALAVDTKINAMVRGFMPYGTGYIDFGSYDDPNSWLNAPNYKKARLELTQNAASASVAVLLEQLNTY